MVSELRASGLRFVALVAGLAAPAWLGGCALPAGPLAPEGVEVYAEHGRGGSRSRTDGSFGDEERGRSRWSQETYGVRVFFAWGAEPAWAEEE